MSSERPFPETESGPFPTPPRQFEDAAGRHIELRAHDGSEAETTALVAMYEAFDPADRAQGLPPIGEERIREWVRSLLDGDERGGANEGDRADGDDAPTAGAMDAFNVLAWHDDQVVGHATLVADGSEGYELAIFVHQDYQGAGVGTHLIEALLGHGADRGVEFVWLTVERWNAPAIRLYENVGFETTEAGTFDMEMAIKIR